MIFLDSDTLSWKSNTLGCSAKDKERDCIHPLRALKEVSMTFEGSFLPLPSFSFAFYESALRV